MIAPNPFFPPFRPMRKHINVPNSFNNYTVKSQIPYSSNANIGGYRNNIHVSKSEGNNLNSNFTTSTNIFPTVFNMENEKSEEKRDKPLFEIFGIQLYLDDLLIIALLFFLYKEECTDDSLFIILVLLLLT